MFDPTLFGEKVPMLGAALGVFTLSYVFFWSLQETIHSFKLAKKRAKILLVWAEQSHIFDAMPAPVNIAQPQHSPRKCLTGAPVQTEKFCSQHLPVSGETRQTSKVVNFNRTAKPLAYLRNR